MKTIIDNTKFTQLIVKQYINSDSACVDMTLGNGNDTLFLAQNCRFVYGFDIQQEAIVNSRRLLEDNNLLDKCQLILDSHENIDKYVKEEVDVFVYNLGYLPNGNCDITTNYVSTINSLQKALLLLKRNGLIIINIYYGHPSGLIEREQLINYVSNLDNKYHVGYYQKLNQTNAPEIVVIEKVK